MADHEPFEAVLTPEVVTAVSLSRGMCMGTCPVYRVTLSTSGHVTYEGEAFVERVGRHQGEVSPDMVGDLVQLIFRLGFTELKDEYPPPATCLPSHELVLWSGQQPRRVVDDGSAPREFWAMTALVDAVVDDVYWKDPEDGELPDEWPDNESEGEEAEEASGTTWSDGLKRREDGKVYCCATLGWVDEATAFDHHWDTNRSLEEYLSERAPGSDSRADS